MDPSNNALNTSDSTVAAAASVIELDSEANSSSSDKTSTYAASNSDVLPILAPLVSSLYAAAPTLREGITFSLITQCFPQMQGSVSGNAKLHGSVSTSKSAGKSGSGSGHILLPALGQAHAALSQTEGPARPQGRTFKEDRLYRRQLGRTRAAQRQLAYNRAFVAVNVLLALCQGHSQVSEAVLQALLGRIYQQLADSDKIFPSPAIMHRYRTVLLYMARFLYSWSVVFLF